MLNVARKNGDLDMDAEIVSHTDTYTIYKRDAGPSPGLQNTRSMRHPVVVTLDSASSHFIAVVNTVLSVGVECG